MNEDFTKMGAGNISVKAYVILVTIANGHATVALNMTKISGFGFICFCPLAPCSWWLMKSVNGRKEMWSWTQLYPSLLLPTSSIRPAYKLFIIIIC